MGDSETVVAQSSAIPEHPSTTVNRDLAASTGIDTMDVDNAIPHEDDRASIQVVSYCFYSNPPMFFRVLGHKLPLFASYGGFFIYICRKPCYTSPKKQNEKKLNKKL